MRPSQGFYAGLFIVTACTLMLQVVQTRILSVLAWYHLAFFVISMAMFGMTAGAVYVYLSRERFSERTLSYDLAYYSLAFAVSTAVCLAVQMTLVPIATKSLTSVLTWVEMALCIAIPFYFSGVVVSLALTRSPFPVGRVYGADLLGAAFGCLGVIPILNHTDGPSTVLWVGVLAAVASTLFSRSRIGDAPSNLPPMAAMLDHRGKLTAALAILAAVNGATMAGLQPLAVKGKFENVYQHIYREWNTHSRVAVREEARNVKPAMWGPSPKLGSWQVDQRVMDIDGDAGTAMYRFEGDLGSLGFLRDDITNLAYFLPGRATAAVIGVGGGRDMLSAAVFGIGDITGIEINPIFVKLLTRPIGFSDLLLSRDIKPSSEFNQLARLPGVKLFVDEGRSWFARSKDQFDFVQMSLIDTWAATGAGAFTLSENGLYTVEAMKIFLRRLSPRGVFTVSRWYSPARPQETGRMLSLAAAALMELGYQHPRRHIFMASEGRIANLIISREPFAESDLQALQSAAVARDFAVLISPDRTTEVPILREILAVGSRDELDRYTASLDLDLTPPTDNRPFFFNQFPFDKPAKALALVRDMYGKGGYGGVYEGNLVATGTLLLLFGVSLVLVIVTIVLPLRHATKEAGGALVAGGTLYFMLIGIGFMMTEIGLLQRASVFLGHPMYSLSVGLFTLILSTGLGSLLSERVRIDRPARFSLWAVATCAYIVALPLWLPHAFLALDGSSLLVRAAVCVAAAAPAGFLMGFGFPTGMRLVSAIDAKPTPWFWGINGAAGVLASVVAVACSIALGIGVTLVVAGVCYLLLIPVAVALLAPAFRARA